MSETPPATVSYTPIYCRPCKKRGPLFNWRLRLLQTPTGVAKMSITGVCAKGHQVSRFIPARGGEDIYATRQGPFLRDDIDWYAVRLSMDAARIQSATFYGYRDSTIRQLRRLKIRVPVLAEVYGLNPDVVRAICKPSNAAKREKKLKRGQPA